MIEFVHNPEIQLFTEFINEFGSEPVLQQITEKIRVVVPGDKFAGMFDKEDAFEYNFKTIWYNKEKVDQLGLSQSECFACISHELGHFLDPSDRWATPQQTREINADQLAVKLGLGKSLQTALGKLIDDNPDNQELVEGMQDRIYSISNQARSF